MFNQIQSYQLAGCRPPLRSKLPRRTPRCRHWRGKLRCGAFQVDDGGDYGDDVLVLGWDTVLLHLFLFKIPKLTYFWFQALQLNSEIISLQGSGREVAPGMPSFGPLLLRIRVEHQNT